MLLGFWNTFPSASPAQALRAWDGAHAGPNSARHGLRHLLSAAAQTQIPIVLLDLKSPVTLSALDHLGVLSQVQSLEEQGVLLLPEVLPVGLPPTPHFTTPAWVYTQLLHNSQQAVTAFGLRPSPFLFSEVLPDGLDGRFWFVFLGRAGGANGVVYRYQQKKVMYVNGYAQFSEPSPIIDAEGLTLRTRSALATLAASGSQEIYFLGSDLTQTSWGEPDAALQAFMYLEEHPWLHMVKPVDLLNLLPQDALPKTGAPSLAALPIYAPTGEVVASGINSVNLHAQVVQALQKAPPGELRDLAWQMYAQLRFPANQALQDLRLPYLAQVGHLLAAANWAVAPRPGADCSQDLDWDGLPECTLASLDFFAVFESEGAGITVAVARTSKGIKQVIAPTYQFLTGWSDPTTWDITRGLAGDPTQVFAFTEKADRWSRFETTVGEGEIAFSSAGAQVKTYTLSPKGIRVTFHSDGFHKITLPLVLDPASRFTTSWSSAYASSGSEQMWQWKKAGGPTLQLWSNGKILPAAFDESRDSLVLPEDPNYAYLAGHYTPFPLALVHVEAQGPIQLELSVLDP